MTARIDPEEIQTTRGEKLLTFALAAFLLVGGLWTYYNPLDRRDDHAIYQPVELSSRDRAAIRAADVARRELSTARRELQNALRQLELSREAYRTSLDANQPSLELQQAYEAGQRSHAAAQSRVARATSAFRRVQPAARAAKQRRGDEIRDRERSQNRLTFALRLGWVLGILAASYWLLGVVRASWSRYLQLAMAIVGFAVVQALVMATDYTTDYIDVGEIGPLMLSLAGTAMTLAAFVALQRHIARRTPQRRVRRGECPFCGFPSHGTPRCEGCGRQTLGKCSACGGPRRVGTAHCGVCGAA